ncbi:MAG: signal recognition particle-docking protein FtsY [Rickettsiales bacterium]|jgi:fused signal recognition particle receptor|nr:signal recognition particle-docking protein FtsY [Rickettsiales bacterium]
MFSIFANKKINEDLLSELENILIGADLGLPVTNDILYELRKNKYNKDVTIQEIKEVIGEYIKKYIKNIGKELIIEDKKPFVIMFLGVNGSGKTTIIGKYAKRLKDEGKKVLIVAGDTYRAGAVAQIEQWAIKSNTDLVKAEKEGQDPTSVAYKGIEKAKNLKYDVVLIDTAGRMHNNVNLIQELQKIERIIKPDENVLVIDATIGQNNLKQIEDFSKAVNITGIILNKLDGTAKGGVLVQMSRKFNKPIYFIGIGEGIDDMVKFDADWYIDKLLK